MRFSILSAWLATALAVWSQTAGADDSSAATVIAACVESAPEEAFGLTELEKACPGLTGALEESGYLPFFAVEARDRLHIHDLEDLQQLRGRYEQSAAGRSPDVDTLRPIFDELRQLQQADRPLTSWERIKRWLSAWLDRRQSDPDSWLSRWLENVRVPEVITRAIVYGAILLVIVLALGVIINELRVAGYLRRRRGALDPDGRAVQPSGSTRRDMNAETEALIAEGNAPALLRMLVATLVRSGRLRTERNLTHRELCSRAAFDDAQERECFQRVAELAERAVYGSGGIQPGEIQPVVAAARALNQKLSGATA